MRCAHTFPLFLFLACVDPNACSVSNGPSFLGLFCVQTYAYDKDGSIAEVTKENDGGGSNDEEGGAAGVKEENAESGPDASQNDEVKGKGKAPAKKEKTAVRSNLNPISSGGKSALVLESRERTRCA